MPLMIISFHGTQQASSEAPNPCRREGKDYGQHEAKKFVVAIAEDILSEMNLSEYGYSHEIEVVYSTVSPFKSEGIKSYIHIIYEGTDTAVPTLVYHALEVLKIPIFGNNLPDTE